MAKNKWELVVDIDRGNKKPIFLQVVDEIIRHICEGRLVSGAALPGTRTLASQLCINRNTVTEAYSELTAQGWIESQHGKGTFVANLLPQNVLISKQRDQEKLIHPVAVEKVIRLKLDDGSPDSRLFPMKDFARTYSEVARRMGVRKRPRETNPKGGEKLRSEIASMLRMRRALPVSAEDILVTRGGQHALFLVAQVLSRVRKGRVAVESPGYRPAWEAFKANGLNLLEIPVDNDGMSVDWLEMHLKNGEELTAVFITPHHQFPTTVTLKQERRLKLIELSEKYDFWIIEDDYDHDFHFDLKPVFPLASLVGASKVIYVSTLSKLLTPDLRLGYLAAPEEILKELTRLREVMDRMGDPILEETLAELFEEGEIQSHANKMRAVYRYRRDLFVGSLRAHGLRNLTFEIPSGGTALWLKFENGIDYTKFSQHLLSRGIVPVSADLFTQNAESLCLGMRIGYASMSEVEIQLASETIASALKTDEPKMSLEECKSVHVEDEYPII